MRFFYIGSRPQVEKTGGEKYMNEVITFLNSHYPVTICDPTESELFKERANKIKFHIFSSQIKSNLWAIRCIKDTKKPSTIIMNSYYRHRFLFFALWARYIRKFRLIIFINAIYHYSRENQFLNILDKIITAILLKSADLIIANSKSTKEEVLALGVRNETIEVIYPRLDMPPRIKSNKINAKAGTFNIIFIGYCEPFKELDVLIKAIGILKYLPLYLYVIGDNDTDVEYTVKIKKLIIHLGIEDRVIFHGRAGKIEIGNWFQSADLFVSPSRGEGYGRALAEAMYFGLSVIGADKGASKELIDHGINGFLFEAGNYKSLASYILKLYENEELRKQFSERSRKLIHKKANFDMNIGNQFLTLLEKYSFLQKNL